MARLLLVEDDDGIAQPLGRALSRDGHDVHRVANGADAVAAAAVGDVDLVLLDLGLPDLDGLEVCRRLRSASATMPIVVLTARTEELDIVVGLDAGADDYLSKPFRVAELLARVRAQLRASAARTSDTSDGEVLEVQDIRVELASRRVFVAGEERVLTMKEYDLLVMLMTHAGTVVTRDDIMREVWDENFHGSTKTLDMHVSWLRRKLGDDPAASRYLTTVRGVGLRFESA